MTDTPVETNSLARVHGVPNNALRAEAEKAAERPRRNYGAPARVLFALLDVIYGRRSTLEKFRVLEVVARVPYQAWEQVAFIAITHTHEDPSFARRVHDRVGLVRAQQDNELFHLLILEEMLDRRDHQRSLIRGRIVPQLIAFGYYHLSWLLYIVRPRFSYSLNADFEDHALHTYLGYVREHPELDDEEWVSEFAEEYGPVDTIGDVIRSIALDERHHRDESEALTANARFGTDR
jgi:hypothetical protein